METGTLITGIILFLICISPIILMYLSNRNREKKLLNSLISIAEQSNATISRYDHWSQSIIGIDDLKNTLFFKRVTSDSEMAHSFNLSEFNKCDLVQNQRTVDDKDGNLKIVDKLALSLNYRDSKKDDLILEFYNRKYDSMTILDEHKLVAKWKELINEAIEGNSNI